MESTNPRMAEKTGSMWDWRIRGISGESWWIRGIQMLCWSRRWATVPGRTKSAEFSVRRTAAGVGRRSYTRTTAQRRWIFVLSRGTREWCTQHCGTGFESQGKKEHRMGPAAGSTNQRMKASPGRKSRGTDFRKENGGGKELRLRREIMGNACT